MGYVLPANQISFWGASVITNLFTEVPYLGPRLVQLMWGGPSVDTPTLARFFAFHFLIPFIVLGLVGVHLALLHETGSNNKLGIPTQTKLKFAPSFIAKDLVGLIIVVSAFTFLCLYYPLALGDDENFTAANPSVTPHHIQPE